MTRERETPPLDQGGAPEMSLAGDEDNCSTRYKLPAPDAVPDYGAGIDCVYACSEGCPFRCPRVWGTA